MLKDKFFLFLLALLGLNLIFRIYSYKNEYLTQYDPAYWESRYLRSQWVIPDSQESIGDDGLYAYAGWEYIRGRDPTTLNAETPPLGKYLIGLFILLFNNQNIFALTGGILVLFVLFKLNLLVFKNKVFSLLPVVFFSFEPLFWQQLRAPFLDLWYLGFLLLTFYFFLKERYFLSALFLGLMMGIKASAVTFILVSLTLLGYLLVKKQFPQIKKFLLVLPVSLTVFLLIYFRYFQLGNNLISFLKVQKWILNFYSIGAKGSFVAVWQMLMTGRWASWWDGVIKVEEWRISWPILLVLSICYSVFGILKKNLEENFLFSLWVLIYLFFLCFVPVWPRYLLAIIPFMYNLTVCLLPFLKSTKEK